jgi:hypothetical protein
MNDMKMEFSKITEILKKKSNWKPKGKKLNN